MSVPRVVDRDPRDESLTQLLDRLETGDPEAADRVFRESEPQLRQFVRRQMGAGLRGRFDSTDIVQSAWAGVLSGLRQAKWQFKDFQHLQAFLKRATRNRFIDRVRQQRGSQRFQQPVGDRQLQAVPEAGRERPSQQVQAEELWQQMLDSCPPEHRELLKMKRMGLSLDEISRRSGFHKSSVRRILYAVARRVSVERKGMKSEG